MRKAAKTRNTKETQIEMELNLDGTGQRSIDSGIGFFNHMLELFSFHSGFDLIVNAKGDLFVDDHHTVEDCGILLGSLVGEALQDKKGISRYGSFTIPMDETLCNVTIDFSGRPYLVYNCDLKREKIGEYSCEMTEEFLRALSNTAKMNIHVNVYYGNNDHHKVEAVFKALGRAMKQGTEIVSEEIPSSKGILE